MNRNAFPYLVIVCLTPVIALSLQKLGVRQWFSQQVKVGLTKTMTLHMWAAV